MPAKIIFTVGYTGTRNYLVNRLESAYISSGKTVIKKGFGNDAGTANGSPAKTKVQRFRDSTLSELILQINEFTNILGDEFDVIIFNGWRMKMFVQELYPLYKDSSTFVCIKENPAFSQGITEIDNGWNLSIQEELDMRNEINTLLSNFYGSNAANDQWLSMALEPTIDISPIRIRTEDGPHMYTILGQPLE